MTAVIRRSPEVAWVDDGERVVVVRLDDPAGDPLVLPDSAAAVWRAIDDGGPVDAVVARVAQAYGIDADAVDLDVRSLLDDAARRGIAVTDPT